MTRNHIELAVLALALVAVFSLGFVLGKGRRKAPETVIKTQTDTLYLRDTITVATPVWLTKTVIARDTFRLADTVRLHDTTFVVLDRERVEWRDNLCTVWASRPSSPFWWKARWGLGVQAGYGVSDKGLTPYVGVGISYNLLAW